MHQQRTPKVRAVFAALLLGSVISVAGFGATAAMADPFTGGFSPTVIGGAADLNGDGVANLRDDANAFYGDTHIINGRLDCDAWNPPPGANAGVAGSGVINSGDNCTLVGYDGTPNGVTIQVLAGEFQVTNGPLPWSSTTPIPTTPTSAHRTSRGPRSADVWIRTATRGSTAMTVTSGSSESLRIQGSVFRQTGPTSWGIPERTSVGSALPRILPTTGSWT